MLACRLASDDGHRSGTLNEMVVERQKKFLVELIKPSHYDDQGYIIQWWRGFVPSNSLSCLYGLALDVRERRALGDDVDIDIEVRDETNSFVPVKTIIRRFAENENRGLVCLVGVQTNQFARAVYLNVPDGDGVFSDNYFDLVPGRKMEVEYRAPRKMTLDQFRNQIKVRSMVDAFEK